jgi:hypothetical protein
LHALEALAPHAVLIEGPPDADDILALAAHEEMQPPVAILTYVRDDPARASFFPFAVFSPEWQAIRYALAHGVPVRFIDLPMRHQLAMRESREPDAVVDDPLSYVARAAGYDDGERWWEHMVEERRDPRAVFQAIEEAMTAMRDELGLDDRETMLREAYMRKCIAEAERASFERIAVVCGAWHVPALRRATRGDAALLKGLPKVAIESTWIPWTHGRLSMASGYGAGVRAPGWYHHLWSTPDRVSVRWLTRSARLLRDAGVDASSAHVIEAVRLAEALAALRDRPLPGLDEHQEATRAVMLFGDALPMSLVHDKLVVGEVLGHVPEETPAVPLARDLKKQQKALRLKASAEDKQLVLDLRKDIDRQRSQLLRRLRLLGIFWGEGGEHAGGKGTFKEAWRIKWDPELAIELIEAAVWGNTVVEAAAARAVDTAKKTDALGALASLATEAMLAELGPAVDTVIERLGAQAAVASDITHLMGALPALAELLRYGDVRGMASPAVARIVHGLVARIAVGLTPACASLSEEAAQEMLSYIERVHSAIALLADESLSSLWHEELAELLDAQASPGLLRGRAARLLLDGELLPIDEVLRRLSLALSQAAEPAHAAAWLEGFLRGSGQLLVHDDRLFALIDAWLIELTSDSFAALLPLLRRTFAAFTGPERRMLGERVARGERRARTDDIEIDPERARRAIPLIARLLGLTSEGA